MDFERNDRYVFPLLRDAAQRAGEPIRLMLTPWSPPAYMKSNGERKHGGKLLEVYADRWAEYMVRTVEHFLEEGMDVRLLSVQNEPNATQRWDSCTMTGSEERQFVRCHLGPALERHDLKERVCLLVWDHNKERALDRAMSIYLQVDLMSDEDGTATTGKQRGLMQRAWRAIAWCALLQGNYKRSIAYSQRVIDRGTPRVNDYMNLGHALLLSREVASAIKQYSHVVALTATKEPTGTSEQAEPEFVKLFNDDRKHLVGRGFNNNDLSLVVDAVLNNKPDDE